MTVDDPVPLATVAASLRWLARELERDGSDLAHIPAQAARVLTRPTGGGCRTCGGPVEPVPRGRPRVHCETCRAPRLKPRKAQGEGDGRHDNDPDP